MFVNVHPARGLLALAFLLPVASARAEPDGPGGALDLQDVFEVDGLLDHLFTATLDELEVRGPDPQVLGGITFVQKTINGIRWSGYPAGSDPTDPQNLELKESRITIELWFPNSIDFQDLDSSWLLLNQGGDPNDMDNDSLRLKRILSKKMARQGIPAAIWFENDLHPVDPLNPVGSIAEQLGYNGDGQLLHTGLTWMMLKDPDVTPLVAEDLRFHFRFGMAQAYMLGTTFVQRFLENHFGPQSSTWTAAMKSVLAGGSKRGTATLTACGVDPRIRGARISGSQSFNADPLGAWARYVKDWGECPGGQLGERAEFTAWAEEHGDDLPSYYSVYAPDRCPEAYQNVFILDIVGTHDYINPLGSHSTFWQRRDGLTDGLPDPTEVSLRHACIRRENKSHGSESFIGTVGRFEISKSLVLLFRLVRHLALDKDLPTIDIVDLNVSDPVTWTARVRVTGQHPVNDEQLSVFLALSDDRDFRRCTPPIVSLPQNPCFEGVGDDNKEEEDKFVRITPTQVTVEGELRTLSFPAPVDVQAFSVTPIVAAFVELVLEGANPNRFGDDIWVDTEVLFRNDELYPELSCP